MAGGREGAGRMRSKRRQATRELRIETEDHVGTV